MTSRFFVALTIVVLTSASVGRAASPPQFEAASIRPHDAAVPDGGMKDTPNGISYSRVTLYKCITTAYQVSGFQISGDNQSQIRGVLAERYDILATAGQVVGKDERRLMLQSLLEDCFKLRIHREMKEMAVLALVTGTKPPKLDRAEGGDSSMKIGPSGVNFKNTPMRGFADFLSGLGSIQRPVLDRTSLDGDFNFILRLSGSHADDTSAPDKRSASDWPSIFTDVQELGLRLEPTKAPVEMLVIDHAEKPSAN